MRDNFKREIDYLRVSVTDRCNYRCSYCMPNGIDSLSHMDILRYEQIIRLIRIFSELGIKKIKITGGEPLVRKDLASLIREIRCIDKIEDITLTTNGYYLKEYAHALREAGISTINISIDTLDRAKYRKICRTDGLDKVLEGIAIAKKLGFNLKINTTLNENIEDKDIFDLVELGYRENIIIRFIEMMPIGMGAINSLGSDIVIDKLEKIYPDIKKSDLKGNGPAVYYEIKDGYNIGFISAIHHKFCDSCNRLRLTADGHIKPCLANDLVYDIKALLDKGLEDEKIKEYLRDIIYNKPLSHRFLEEGKKSYTMNTIGG